MPMCLCFSPFYQAEEASRAQLEQQPLPSAGKELNCNLLLISTAIKHTVNQNEIPARSNKESILLQTAATTPATITVTTTTTNNNKDKRPPVTPINLYDPIQQHPSVIPHLNTSSGNRYALPSPKSTRASKPIDTATSVNKVCM